MIFFISFFFLPLLCTHGEYFVAICESYSGHHCCAPPGLETSEYWSSLDIECRLESEPYSHLVMLETRGESDCIVKYLTDEYGEAQKKYAIGLKSPNEYRGVYEWRGADVLKAMPEGTIWAANYPRDSPYVFMTVGTGAAQNGRWADTSASDYSLYGICERTK